MKLLNTAPSFNGTVEIKVDNPIPNNFYHWNFNSNDPPKGEAKVWTLLTDPEVRAHMDLFERATPYESKIIITVHDAHTENPFLRILCENIPRTLRNIEYKMYIKDTANPKLAKLIHIICKLIRRPRDTAKIQLVKILHDFIWFSLLDGGSKLKK